MLLLCTASIRPLWIAANILLFRLFSDMVDLSHNLIRRITLKRLSAVAELIGTNYTDLKGQVS